MQFTLTAFDRELIRATQKALPRTPQPYHALAAQLNAPVIQVMERLQWMLDNGVIRRIAVVPNHYALGYKHNGMTVWNVPDVEVDRLGAQVGALPFVTHCYRRPRHLPLWEYNLFAMVHGKTQSVVDAQIAEIAALLGEFNLGHEVLFSTKILKKTGLQIGV